MPGNGTAGNQHFYLQAFGVPYGEFQDFALGQQSRGLSETDLQGVEENAWRPKFFVPLTVPVYDENNSLIQEQAYMTYKNQQMAEGVDPDTIEKPEGMYQWLSRPEYQFSVYDLEVSDIRVNEYLEDGSIDTVNILDNDDPTIASSETYLEILYELYGINNDRLDSYQSEDQILILNVAGQETEIHITDNGSLELNDLSFLDKLGSTDYLVISFYLNNDTGNILWEYAFGRNGLHVYGPFEFAPYLDDDLMLSRVPIAEVADPVRALVVYTLGGVRLRYGYQPPAEIRVEDVQSVKLQIEHPGWYCTQPGVNTEEHCTYSDGEAPFEITQPYYPPFPYHINGIPKWSVWWQPATENGGGSGDTLWSNELDINAHYTATFTQLSHMAPVTEYFKIKSRTIKPNSESDEINKGSDIQLVEAILWQLGISPQKGGPGSEGARIASNRGGSGAINTKDCNGDAANDRSVYYAGWSTCPQWSVSTEGMIRRFQGRSEGGERLESGIIGNVGPKTIAWLRDDFESYMQAYSEYSTSSIVGKEHAQIDTWIQAATDIWKNGLESNSYVAVGGYTDDIHNGVLSAAGVDDTTKTRAALIKAWKLQESPYHWGTNTKDYQATPFRMTEGGADEQGSLGFNQVLYKYRYSDRPCSVHKAAGLNYYHPLGNIKGFAIHTMMKSWQRDGEINCGSGGLYQAFHNSSFAKSFETDIVDLKGYQQGTQTVTYTNTPRQEDDYEKLAKGIGYYNSNTPGFTVHSWPYILKHKVNPPAKSTSNDGDNCFTCRYTIQVRNEKYGLPYRQYIWQGGSYTADLTDADGNPDPRAGQAWCFEYGEREWVSGTTYAQARQNASDTNTDDAPQTPVGRVNCN